MKEILCCGKLGAHLQDSSPVGFYTFSLRFPSLTLYSPGCWYIFW